MAAVAPRAGAWIETTQYEPCNPTAPSHPVRVRGLKRLRNCHPIKYHSSHPVRVRGLKLYEPVRRIQPPFVAPRAGAWIETGSQSMPASVVKSHPVRVRGLKHFLGRKTSLCV